MKHIVFNETENLIGGGERCHLAMGIITGGSASFFSVPTPITWSLAIVGTTVGLLGAYFCR
jgi:hypothetical protein